MDREVRRAATEAEIAVVFLPAVTDAVASSTSKVLAAAVKVAV
jgi:hypothetical protein